MKLPHFPAAEPDLRRHRQNPRDGMNDSALSALSLTAPRRAWHRDWPRGHLASPQRRTVRQAQAPLIATSEFVIHEHHASAAAAYERQIHRTLLTYDIDD